MTGSLGAARVEEERSPSDLNVEMRSGGVAGVPDAAQKLAGLHPDLTFLASGMDRGRKTAFLKVIIEAGLAIVLFNYDLVSAMRMETRLLASHVTAKWKLVGWLGVVEDVVDAGLHGSRCDGPYREPPDNVVLVLVLVPEHGAPGIA